MAGMLVGSVIMAVSSIFVNLFLVYPAYMLVMPQEAIVDMYSALVPWADEIWKGILVFNTPHTFCKAILDSLITFLLYKRLSPVLKGRI